MQIIVNANETILQLLKRFRKPVTEGRLSHFCVQAPVEEGILLQNVLTREMILVYAQELDCAADSAYLQDHLFVVEEDARETEYADFLRWILETRKKPTHAITGYTIFPTTDCNARCFYCFELGRSRIPMSLETAEKVALYMKDHCQGKKVGVNWFGGEPLFNRPAIDTICRGLHREGVEFESFMITNGYLFDADSVRAACELWNLKRVQITLDGTEAVYNKIKAYIHRDASPYRRVLGNIESLLDAGIKVVIRMNMDLSNAEDLLALAEELSVRFRGRENLQVYAHHLFSGNESMASQHTQEEWELRESAMCRIEEALERSGLLLVSEVTQTLETHHCMADSDDCVTILPDGNIGLCEHFSETDLIGHIDREGFDQELCAAWKERMPAIPACQTCFYYPECIKLKKCANGNLCFPVYPRERLRRRRRNMVYSYRKWQKEH